MYFTYENRVRNSAYFTIYSNINKNTYYASNKKAFEGR